MLSLIMNEIVTPIGKMLAVVRRDAQSSALVYLDFMESAQDKQALGQQLYQRYHVYPQSGEDALLQSAQVQLDDYFCGKLREFSLSLAPHGTPFQQQVWQLLRQIPYGETWSYSEQAQRYGNLQALRAVAAANGKNPLAIVVPCHRVIGKNGALTGYAGGLARKAFLLELEQRFK